MSAREPICLHNWRMVKVDQDILEVADMKIEHIALYVKDLEVARDFL